MGRAASPDLWGIPERSPACADVITRAAKTLELRSEEVIAELVAFALAGLESMREEPLREALDAAAHGIVPLLTEMARGWADPRIVPPPHDSIVLAHTLAARDLSIALLLRALRLGQARYQEMWHREIAASGASPDVILEAINACSVFIFVWIDALSEPLVSAYEEEQARRAGAREAVRSETVARLLAGDDLDEQTAGARMNYALGHAHVGAIVWIEPGHEAADGLLSSLALRVAETLGASTLVVLAGPRVAHVWAHRPAIADDLVPSLRDVVRGTAARIAVGDVADGVAGFRRTHAEALRSQRVAQLLRRRAMVTCYTEDVAVSDLLIRDPVAARDVAVRALGALAEPNDQSRRLLATLAVFVEEGSSITRTAQRLGLHKNTVSYRLRRAAELSGHPDATSPGLQAAARLAPLLDSDLG